MKKRGVSQIVVIWVILILVGGVFSLAQPGVAESREPYKIELYTIPAGYPAYSISVGVADILNKKSQWLKATALEGRGPIVGLKEMAKNKKRRPHFFFFLQPKWVWGAMNKMGPFKKSSYDFDTNIKYVAVLESSATIFITLDPNIKTIKDFKGKRVVLDSMRGGARQVMYEDLFKAEGILDTIKFEFTRGPAAANMMRDGLLDISYAGFSLVDLPNKWRVAPYMSELMATKPTYFVGIPGDWYADYKKRSGHPDLHITIPAGTGGATQTKPVGGVANISSWAVHADMPDDVVYEFCKVTYENVEKLKEFSPHAAVLTKKTLGSMSVPEDKIHPGALKFYKEKGVPISTLFK